MSNEYEEILVEVKELTKKKAELQAKLEPLAREVIAGLSKELTLKCNEYWAICVETKKYYMITREELGNFIEEIPEGLSEEGVEEISYLEDPIEGSPACVTRRAIGKLEREILSVVSCVDWIALSLDYGKFSGGQNCSGYYRQAGETQWENGSWYSSNC